MKFLDEFEEMVWKNNLPMHVPDRAVLNAQGVEILNKDLDGYMQYRFAEQWDRSDEAKEVCDFLQQASGTVFVRIASVGDTMLTRPPDVPEVTYMITYMAQAHEFVELVNEVFEHITRH